jgi:predicted ATP-grasp superfamily ATP-dependent carboligase
VEFSALADYAGPEKPVQRVGAASSIAFDMRFLVTAASTFFATRLIQGLGARGVEATAADSHWLSVGKVSRHTARRLRTPSLARDPAGYLATLVRELRTRPYDLLLPTFEESLLLAEFRDELEPLTRLFLPPFEVMWELHYKPNLYRRCLDLEIPTPPTVVPGTALGLEHQVAGLRFPVVVKLPAANNCVGRAYCDSLPELIERFTALYQNEIRRGAPAPFVQQKIDGEPVYTLMLCHAGKKLGEVLYRPLRTFPENGGTSAHRESIAHPEISAISARLAGATGWTGFLGLDFIVDRRDGTPYLIDANPRSSPAIHLGYLGGVDWTGMLVELLRGREPAPVIARPGVRSRTPLLDVGWLLEGFRPQPGWPQSVVKRVRRFLRPEWQLDSGHDFLGNRDWLCHVTLGCQAAVAGVKSLATGRSVGQTILEDENYDPITAQQFRAARKAAAAWETWTPAETRIEPLAASSLQ